MRIIFTLLSLVIFSPENSFGLVDYSPKASGPRKMSAQKIDISNLQTRKRTKRGRSVVEEDRLSRLFFFSTGYNSVAGDGVKYDQYNLGITLMTPWKIYFDLDVTYGGGTEQEDTFSLGNTEFSMGATWLEFGSRFDMITIDVVGGMSLGVDDSDIGSRRSDSYVGLLSKKNFGVVDLSLGFEYWFMDSDNFDTEISIGSFNKYLVNAGWTVSNDIRFDLGVQFINLGEIDSSEELSYTEISPQVGLRLGHSLNLNLGARFSSEKDIENIDLEKLKVWNVTSLYGNSYFTKISFNF
jgi:hypothetical protein